MGEEAWTEYQKLRKIKKAADWKKRNVDKVVEWRRRTKKTLIEYKGGRCERCGYNKDYPSVYEFHHRNPDEKEFSISRRGSNSIEKLKKEVDKCDLVCSNCHAEIHEDLRNKN